jgi:ubiquitin C-terminal hydrolase
LYGIIEHNGNLDMGHYIAKCKNNREWVEFNDSNVDVNSDNIVNNNAYVLFYIKKGLKDDF